ncbi:Outer membrane receptor proteins, mostly Fe transport [Mariniphaga anaerophila]|uniref:Outer membrane receptor proteins, mostly Fe transport n=1 Tax=Mariniphaga anaerophila TaxID=1484053 RepID=A0A1M5CUE3_9BACT|nr:TonB-dependent receptor [Mariniphaga anaerophila]SHF58370.1 Outer membrane receptor proteins, mostly Fe transport [Mariniphaga anaerophila]
MKKLLLLILTISFFQVNTFARETEQDSIKKYKLDEIVIQSPKYNRNVFEIPAAASMIPERLIENNRVESLTDISTLIPNFFMPDYGSKLTSPVYIRGVGNRINTPSVGLYVDEIPYFEKAAFNFDFYNVERIEVLRGPQGTLYGRNTMGGLINVITNKPRDKRATTVSVDYGNYNQIRSNITHNQPIGKKVALQGSLNQRHNDGFYNNTFSNTEVDKINSYSGQLKALFTPSKKFNALANIQYEDSRQGGYPYALFDEEKMTAGEISYDKESLYNRKLLSAGLNLKYTATDFSVRAVSSFQSLDDFQEIDQDFTPESLFFVVQDQQLQMLAQEINIESNQNGNYNWLFGAFGFKQLLDKAVTVEYGEDGLVKYKIPLSEYYYTKTYNNSNSGVAFFHQSTLDLGGFTFSAGIRADYEKATLDYADDRVRNGNSTRAEEFDSDMDFFEILPKVALKYSINEYLVPYVTVAKGYNSGGFNSTFEDDENRTFDPEQSWNYEAGLKAKWLQQRIYANLAFFYIDWTNQQVYQTVPSGTGSMLTNAGKSESKGVELELKALPAQNFETWLTFGYNEAKFIDYVKNENQDYSGNYLPYVPKYSFNVGGNYMVNVRAKWLDRVRFNLSYNGFGKHYWHESNEAYQNFYGLLNHRINFEKNNVVFSFWGKNILNADYNSFYFQALGNSYAQIGKPATFGVNLKVTF